MPPKLVLERFQDDFVITVTSKSMAYDQSYFEKIWHHDSHDRHDHHDHHDHHDRHDHNDHHDQHDHDDRHDHFDQS
jgi:hypothetical protein